MAETSQPDYYEIRSILGTADRSLDCSKICSNICGSTGMYDIQQGLDGTNRTYTVLCTGRNEVEVALSCCEGVTNISNFLAFYQLLRPRSFHNSYFCAVEAYTWVRADKSAYHGFYVRDGRQRRDGYGRE